MVSLPKDITFNYMVSLYLMFLDTKPVLNIVCLQTHYNEAEFLPNELAEAVWLTFILVWTENYISHPKSFEQIKNPSLPTIEIHLISELRRY